MQSTFGSFYPTSFCECVCKLGDSQVKLISELVKWRLSISGDIGSNNELKLAQNLFLLVRHEDITVDELLQIIASLKHH